MTTELRKRAMDTQPVQTDTSVRRSALEGVLSGPAGLALVVAVAQLLAIWAHVRLYHDRASDFVQIGHRFGDPLGLSSLASSPVGYDGQFFYFIARFSGHLPSGAMDYPALRYSRIFYPALVRLLSLGNVSLIPWAMLGLNIAAIAGTAALAAWLIVRLGGPTWMAFAVGLYCGQTLALLRDLSDPIAVFFGALALVGIAQRRWILVAVALGLGMLDRESTLFFVVCCALPLVRERRWRLLVVYAALALIPYFVWQLILHWWLGTWGWQQSTQINTFLPMPFSGLAGAQNIWYGMLMFLFACVPALVAIAAGSAALLRRSWDNPLILTSATAAILYGVALILQPSIHWQDIWEPFRLAATIPLLLAILYCELKPRLQMRVMWYVLFVCLGLTYLMTLVV